MEYHVHPQNSEAKVYGRLLEKGEVIKEGDVYPSSTGIWDTCSQFVGTEVDGNTMWVRRPRKYS